jgi:acyl carrier protein
MIPSIIIRLEHLPLNANGKVDYEALPDPFVSMNKSYVPPVSEVELKLVEIWSEILGMEKEKIGLADGFFSLGGNSIKVVQLGQKIEDTFGITIPLAEFFDDDSVNAIIRKI